MKIRCLAAAMLAAAILTGCNTLPNGPDIDKLLESAVSIALSDTAVTVDGAPAGEDPGSAVYTARDIVYYEEGKDFTYGEGTAEDAHSAENAAAHTVVYITEPGVYSIEGTLTRGQIAVDLGEDAQSDPNAAVTLILNGVEITCEVAPAVIFYRVYECGDKDADKAKKDVDTSAAGAAVVIADGTVNTVRGAYVARIYQSGSVVLNENGTKVEVAKKLHKYDGAFYSKMSMNIFGGKEGTGVLNIHARNEGLGSECHLTIHGGNINIFSGNDGINTNEDGVSVTTVNGGTIKITVTGETGEGDGIDSNGWLVINGGTVIASACATSADAGIDSDMGIHINGGTVIASGHMLDRIEDGGQTYVVLSFEQEQQGGKTVSLNNESGETVLEICCENSYSVLIVSSGDLTPGIYALWSDGEQLAGGSGGMMGGMPGGQPPPGGQMPPEGQERPEGGGRPDRPGGDNESNRGPGGFGGGLTGEVSAEFRIVKGANLFSGIKQAK